MSKMDGLRAMREARHAEMVARAKTAKDPASTTTPTTPADAPSPTTRTASTSAGTAKAPAKAAARTAAATPFTPAPTDEAPCGHRNMSGRTCTREKGHAAKSHRYS